MIQTAQSTELRTKTTRNDSIIQVTVNVRNLPSLKNYNGTLGLLYHEDLKFLLAIKIANDSRVFLDRKPSRSRFMLYHESDMAGRTTYTQYI